MEPNTSETATTVVAYNDEKARKAIEEITTIFNERISALEEQVAELNKLSDSIAADRPMLAAVREYFSVYHRGWIARFLASFRKQ